MCKECGEVKHICNGDKMFYESFDDLTDDLKDKFQSKATRRCSYNCSKRSYTEFINVLNKNGHTLLTSYTKAGEKVLIDFHCGHDANPITPNKYLQGRRCPYCYKNVRGELTRKGRVKNGNTVANRYPKLVKCFVNGEDAYNYTCGSQKVVWFKCPLCGELKQMRICEMIKQCNTNGFACPKCGDGFSYPEKFFYGALVKLGVKFETQKTYDSDKTRYDFFSEEWCNGGGNGGIVETHGIQHYKGWNGNEEDLIKQENNDINKKYNAIHKHGIAEEDYNVIDCRYSTLEWCRPRVEKMLSKYYDISILTDEDWKEIDIQAQKSFKIEICKFWDKKKSEDSNFTLIELMKYFNVKRSSLLNYLTWGNENGFCCYDSEQEKFLNTERSKVYVYLLDTNKKKVFENKMCLKEMQEITGIHSSTLKRCLTKQTCLSGGRGHCKYDSKYIGYSVILATDDNKNTDTELKEIA